MEALPCVKFAEDVLQSVLVLGNEAASVNRVQHHQDDFRDCWLLKKYDSECREGASEIDWVTKTQTVSHLFIVSRFL